MTQRRWITVLGLVLLIALFATRLVDAASRNAFTVDEPNYVGTGLYLWESGDYHYFRALRFHPPLVFHVAALPLLALDLGDVRVDPGLGPRLMERGEPPIETLRLATRLPFIAIACWGALLCFAWAREVAGPVAGLFAAFLFTFCPSILAHGSLVHSDITVTVLFLQTLYAFWRWVRRPTWVRLALCGASLGLALLAKLTAILLFGILGIGLLVAAWPRREEPGAGAAPEPIRGGRVWAQLGGRVLGSGALLFASAMAVVWLGYGGSFAAVVNPDGPFPELALPGFIQSFLFVDHVNASGRAVYFLGEFATRTSAAFYPVAFAIKEPLALAALAIAAVASLAWRRGRLAGFLAPAFAVYGWILIVWVDVPLGYRYALPLFPLVFVFVATQLLPADGRFASIGLALACGVLAFESAFVHPHYLSFFNAGVGGPDRGHEYLLDANLDWGQDITTVSRELLRRDAENPWLALYGPEDPGDYGVTGRVLRGCEPVAGWLAISANIRWGLYSAKNPFARPEPDCYAWLDAYEPVARPGHSIWLYQLPEPDVRGVER